MAEATAAGRGVRLKAANLPAASPFVNPDSTSRFGAPRAAARGGRASIIPPSAATKGPPPRRRACWRDRRWWAHILAQRARRGAPRALGAADVPLDVPCRCARTDAGGALGREASMPPRWRAAPRSSPARRSTAKREALGAGGVARPRRAVPLRQDQCRWRDWSRGPRCQQGSERCRIKSGERSTASRSMLGACRKPGELCRRSRTNAGA